ncbi:MAG: hypothetical protein H6825_01695 [Planctomycetes bacterium]|nr:hypothetical protein [Planctomycetota bacterium]
MSMERRLLAVLRASAFVVRQGRWHYEQFSLAEFPRRARADALALVQNGHGWSQLVPLPDDTQAREPLVIWSFQFAPDAPNSGFVGWLASTIKEVTGSGVIVVCGYDTERGGVYDHWGCPAGVADQVFALLDELRAPPRSTAVTSGCSLHGAFMNATVTAEAGVIDADTVFHFRQDGDRVSARYAGGRLEDAHLMGTLQGDTLRFRYVQRQTDGTVDGGESTCTVERLTDGRLQIRERFEWASRAGSGENLITELR